MEFATAGHFSTAGLRWFLPNGTPAYTVVCKTTFALHPGESPLAETPESPQEEDSYWDDDAQKSLSSATDLVPYKARADLVIVGHTFAPENKPQRSWVARVMVGTIHKAIEVYGDRAFGLDGDLREGAPTARVRLRYERAAGGPESWNPVGMRFDTMSALGATPIPNLQPPGVLVSRRGDSFGAIGFGPIAPGWPGRRTKLHGAAIGFGGRGWNERPLPEGVEAGYFNMAPPDQQLDLLRPDERLVLECLHPGHTRLVTRLKGVAPTAMFERRGQRPQPVPLVCDTLWIDTDRGICHLVWRGAVTLTYPAETGRMIVTSGRPERDIHEASAATTIAPLVGASALTLPFAGATQEEERSSKERGSVRDNALPFGGLGGVASAIAKQYVMQPGAAADSTMYLFDAMETTAAPPAPAAPPPAPPPPPPPPPAAAPVIAARAPDPVPPAFVPLPAAVGAAEKPPTPKGESIGQRLAAEQAMSDAKAKRESKTRDEPELLAPAGRLQNEPVVAVSPVASVDEKAAKRGWKTVGSKPATAPITDVAKGGVLAAMSAAAGPQPVGTPRDLGPGPLHGSRDLKDAVELLWFDSGVMGRVRKQPVWKDLLSQVKPKPLDDEPGADAPPEKKQEGRDRREMAVILARGEAMDLRGIEATMANAVTDEGVFVPPLVLVAGDLALPFDEVETLKATIAAVTPFMTGDVKLQASVETAQKLLQTPWLNEGAGDIATGLTNKIKEAFTQSGRALPTRSLENHTEKMLVHQRAYQKRTLFGKPFVRGELVVAGGKEGVAVYLAEEAVKELPALVRISVKVLGEVRGRLEEAEERGWAVKVLGVGRKMARSLVL